MDEEQVLPTLAQAAAGIRNGNVSNMSSGLTVANVPTTTVHNACVEGLRRFLFSELFHSPWRLWQWRL
jgi:hypothetical protein